MIADNGLPSTGFMGSCRWVCVKPRLLGSHFSHAVSLQGEAMGIVDEPIKNGIRDGRISDQFVPVIDGELARDDRRGASVAVIEDFQEIASLFRGERRQAPVIQDQQLHARQHLEEPAVTAIAAREQQAIEQS